MEQTAVILTFASILITSAVGYKRSKQKAKVEQEALLILIYMLTVQNNLDANGILFELEKYSDHNRNSLNILRIDILRNNMKEYSRYRKKMSLLIIDTISVLVNSSALRAAEFLEESRQKIRYDHSRKLKMINEMTASGGIILTMIMMFIIVIYFLKPYSEFFNI